MTDFKIETVLTSYTGNDEIVKIPRGITMIITVSLTVRTPAYRLRKS